MERRGEKAADAARYRAESISRGYKRPRRGRAYRPSRGCVDGRGLFPGHLCRAGLPSLSLLPHAGARRLARRHARRFTGGTATGDRRGRWRGAFGRVERNHADRRDSAYPCRDDYQRQGQHRRNARVEHRRDRRQRRPALCQPLAGRGRLHTVSRHEGQLACHSERHDSGARTGRDGAANRC